MDQFDVVLNYTVGYEMYQVTFGMLDDSVTQAMQLCVVHGVAIGFGVILLILSWMCIVKRNTPMFILNQLTLTLMIIKSALYLCFLFGPLNSLTYRYTGSFSQDIWGPLQTYIATNVIHTLLIACVEATLVYQIHVVFKSPEMKRLGSVLTLGAICLAGAIVALYLHSTVILGIALKRQLMNQEVTPTDSWVNNVPLILFSASLNVVCAILVFKLVLAIKTRRYLGLKQFDGFHILTIMSTQTFIIPSVLMIVNYKQSSSYLSLLANISLILAVCNLPFSSLWATSANNSPQPTSSPNTVFSRWDSKVSDSETLAHEFPMIPGKTEKVHLVSPTTEKGDVQTVCESHRDQDSIEHILDTFDEAVMTTELKFESRV